MDRLEKDMHRNQGHGSTNQGSGRIEVPWDQHSPRIHGQRQRLSREPSFIWSQIPSNISKPPFERFWSDLLSQGMGWSSVLAPSRRVCPLARAFWVKSNPEKGPTKTSRRRSMHDRSAKAFRNFEQIWFQKYFARSCHEYHSKRCWTGIIFGQATFEKPILLIYSDCWGWSAGNEGLDFVALWSVFI